MVKKIEYSNTNDFSCELCGEKFGNNFGLAEHHEIHECKVGHEVRMAFWRGEIESPMSENARKKDAEKAKKRKEREQKKLKKIRKEKLSQIKKEIKRAQESVKPELLDIAFDEKIKDIENTIEKEEADNAEKLINDISKEIKNILDNAEPEIIAKIPSELQANVWVRSTISVHNEGDAHACDVKFNLDGLEVRYGANSVIDFLKAGDTKDVDIALRTDAAGDIPVAVSIEFGNQYDKRELNSKFTEWVTAGATPVTSSVETTLPTAKTTTKTSAPIEDWKPPEGLDGDLEILAEFFALRRNAYQASPANEALLDELHNRREDFAISSYFEIPTSSADILQEWARFTIFIFNKEFPN